MKYDLEINFTNLTAKETDTINYSINKLVTKIGLIDNTVAGVAGYTEEGHVAIKKNYYSK